MAVASQPVSPIAHLPQLDALRAFAVAVVLVHHLFPTTRSVVGGLGGLFGVKLFFVLSGFLITRILLAGRNAAAEFGFLHIARQFYIRRTLRIFPLYYFAIAVGLLAGMVPVREDIWWLVTYTFNFRAAATGLWPENISHFWTLAVEEQFYLIWPWVILLLPFRWLVPVTVATILIGPAYRVLALALGFNGVAFYAVTLSSLDALGSGALLAILSTRATASEGVQRSCRLFVLPMGLGLIATLHVINGLSSVGHALFVMLIDAAIAMVSVGLVAGASSGLTGAVGRLLHSEPLRYCGRISYGLYVYHLLLYSPIHDLGVSFGMDWQREGFFHGAVTAVATLLVASLSWHLMERPINALKDGFTHRHRAPRPIPLNEGMAAVGLQATRIVPVLTARQ